MSPKANYGGATTNQGAMDLARFGGLIDTEIVNFIRLKVGIQTTIQR